MRQIISSGGFEHCRFCYGRGCLACPGERKKYEERMEEPIFVAKRDKPHDIELLKRYFGKDALEHAFGLEGEGMQEVMINATIARLSQEMEQMMTDTENQPPQFSSIEDMLNQGQLPHA